MTGPLAVLVALAAALNPGVLARRRAGKPRGPWLVGAVIGLGVALVLAALAEPVRDALSVSAPTMRTAAGAVLGLTGARWLVGPAPNENEAEPTVDGTLSTFTPAVVLTALATAAEDGWFLTAGLLTLAFALAVALPTADHRGAVVPWAIRGFGGLAVAAGIGLAVSGVEMV